MTISKFMAAAVLAAALAVPGSAQSASELLQKGIYTQETAGDLDGAIQIFRQIVASAPTQHEIAAEAQYRLAQALVRKGDLTGAALEFQKLARDYSEYQALISRLAAAPVPVVRQATATPPASAEFDLSTSAKVTGEVTQVLWMNPRAWVHVKDGIGTDWSIQLASPNQLIRQGVTRNSLKIGDQVTVNAFPAKDGSKTVLANTVIRDADGTKIFDRASVAEPTPAEQDQLKAQMQQAQQQLNDQAQVLRQQHETRPGVDANAYIIGPNDVLYIEVFNQPRFTRPVGVRPDGKINMPIIGDLQAAGLTPNKLRDQIKEAYAGEIGNPIVDVTVTQINSQQRSVR
jgi:hypothetical protein